ncbi:MAG TPA: hypothetical protein VEU08_17190 [Vicinamibacterales bacterium]|nr:hypothetical protein [Vicinamibacterales bacterium]
MAATATKKRAAAPPEPGAIVRFYPNPVEVIRAYVESDFHQQLATEHERKVTLLAEEGADVSDAISFQRVGERLVDVASHRKDVEGFFKPLKDFAYRLHRMVCDRESAVLRPLQAFESAAKSNAQAWQRDEERKRREEEQRRAEEGRKAEEERLAREAELLEQRGEPELAAQVLEQAVNVPAPVVVLPSSVPTVQGMTFRERWCWRPLGGDTPQARARAIQLAPREFLTLDEKKLNAYARSHGASAKVPGLEFFDAGSVAVRT